MSKDKYEEGCPGCQPAVLDTKTLKPLPDDHPLMKTVLAFWETTTVEERTAFHNVTCANSRKDSDLRIMQDLMRRMRGELEE